MKRGDCRASESHAKAEDARADAAAVTRARVTRVRRGLFSKRPESSCVKLLYGVGGGVHPIALEQLDHAAVAVGGE